MLSSYLISILINFSYFIFYPLFSLKKEEENKLREKVTSTLIFIEAQNIQECWILKKASLEELDSPSFFSDGCLVY